MGLSPCVGGGCCHGVKDRGCAAMCGAVGGVCIGDGVRWRGVVWVLSPCVGRLGVGVGCCHVGRVRG